MCTGVSRFSSVQQFLVGAVQKISLNIVFLYCLEKSEKKFCSGKISSFVVLRPEHNFSNLQT